MPPKATTIDDMLVSGQGNEPFHEESTGFHAVLEPVFKARDDSSTVTEEVFDPKAIYTARVVRYLNRLGLQASEQDGEILIQGTSASGPSAAYLEVKQDTDNFGFYLEGEVYERFLPSKLRDKAIRGLTNESIIGDPHHIDFIPSPRTISQDMHYLAMDMVIQLSESGVGGEYKDGQITLTHGNGADSQLIGHLHVHQDPRTELPYIVGMVNISAIPEHQIISGLTSGNAKQEVMMMLQILSNQRTRIDYK